MHVFLIMTSPSPIDAFGKGYTPFFKTISLTVLRVMNGMGTFGRLFPTLLPHQVILPINTLTLMKFLAGILVSC